MPNSIIDIKRHEQLVADAALQDEHGYKNHEGYDHYMIAINEINVFVRNNLDENGKIAGRFIPQIRQMHREAFADFVAQWSKSQKAAWNRLVQRHHE
jgi:hypothetical protein